MEDEERLEELSKKLDEIIKRLDLIEKALKALGELGFLPELMGLIWGSTRLCSSRLQALRRALTAEEILRRLEPGDDISRHIIEALAEGGPMNISELTRAVRARRGRASRRTIRERLEELLEQDLVVEVEGFGRKFDLPARPSDQSLAKPDHKREER